MSRVKQTTFYKFTLIIIFIFSAFSSFAQEYFWKAGMINIADNREYFNDFQKGETILASRINGSVGIKIDDDHHFVAGLDYMFEYGHKLNAQPIIPVLYYHYDRQPLEFMMGSFPRFKKLNYPNMLVQNKFVYYHPNIQGLYAKVFNQNHHQAIWVNWLQKQTLTQREKFMYGGHGRLNFNRFFFEHYFVMIHQAKSLQSTSEHIRDNGGLIARFGLHLNPSKSILDTFYLSAGPSFTADQLRGSYNFRINTGFTAMLDIRKNWMGLQAHYFHNPGTEILSGAPIYQAKNYTRLNCYFDIIEHRNMNLKFEYDLHFMSGIIDHSQSIVISVDLQNSFKRSSAAE